MKRSLICAALLCVLQGATSAQEKPTTVRVTTTATAFDSAKNTYSFVVRFIANPCPDVSYDISFSTAGAKDSKDAVRQFQPQIDKITDDVTKDERCHH